MTSTWLQRFGPGLSIAMVLVPLAMLSLHPISSWDIWWHLATGREIVQQGALPQTELFSFAVPGALWETHEGLSQLIFYAVFEAAGPHGLIAVRALLRVMTYLCIFVILRRRNYPLAATLTLIIFLSLFLRSSVRPYLFSYFLFVLEMLILESAWRHKLSFLKGLGVFCILVLWANMHGEFILGIALLGTYVVATVVKQGQATRSDPGKETQIRAWLILGVLGIAACCLTPRSFHTLTYPFLHAQRTPMHFETIGEWHRPQILPLSLDTVFYLSLPFFLGSIFCGARENRRWLLLLLPAVFLVQACLHFRMISYFYLSCLCCLGPLPPSRLLRWITPTCQVLLSAFVLAVECAQTIDAGLLTRSIARQYPAAAVAEIPRLQLEGPMLNQSEWGGYLIWHLYPTHRVFILGTMPLSYDAEVFPDYRDLFDAGKFEKVLKKYEFRFAVLPPESAIAGNLRSKGWIVIFRDPDRIGDILVPP